MASNNIARLGVVLGLDTASWSADIDKAISENRKLGMEIKRASQAAAAEIANLKYATEDYGKEVSKVTQIEREIKAGRFTNALPQEIEMLKKAAAEYDAVAKAKKVAVTGGLTPQQAQALAYQTTDLVTQIASGQNAMIALLQQGGQLKDQMGGFGNMFRMLSSVITPFRLLVAGTATALGVLGLAFYQGQKESARLRDDLILTGNYADMTQKKFFDLSNTISTKVGIAIGDAKDIMSQLVASGKFTGQSIDSVAEAIARVAQLSGKSAQEMAGQLIPMFNGTAASAKQLNDKYHVLTLEQYKQIEVLEKQNKLQESSKLLADALNKTYADQKRELGLLESAWKSLTEAVSRGWDAMLGIGRKDDALTRLQKVSDIIDKYTKNIARDESAGRDVSKKREELQKYIDEYVELAHQISKTTSAEAQRREESKKISDWESAGGYKTFLSKKDQLDKERLKTQFAIEQEGATEINRIKLEAQQKILAAIAERDRKNRDENNQFAIKNAEELELAIANIGLETNQKIMAINAARYSQLSAAQEEMNRQLVEGEAIFDNAYKTIENSIKEETRLLELKRDELDIAERMLYMSDAEIEKLKIKMDYEKKRAEIRRDPNLSEERQKALIDQLDTQERFAQGLVDMQERLKTFRDMSNSVFDNMMRGIETFVRTGKMSFKDLARSIIQDLIMIQMKAQMTGIFRMIGAAITGSNPIGASGYSDMGTFTALMQANGLANGGPIGANEMHLVGERGPELFVPSGAGTIVPHERLSSSLGGSTNVTNNYINAIDVKSFEERLFGSANAIWAASTYAQKRLPLGSGRM